MEFLMQNVGTLLVLAALLLIIAGILHSLRKDRKAGKSSCGQNCAHCAMSGKCHQKATGNR